MRPIAVTTSLALFIVLLAVFLIATPTGVATAKSSANYPYVKEFARLGFDNMAVCHDHKYLLGVNSHRHTVTILNIETGGPIALIGVDRVNGTDNRHFNRPFGVACDETTNRILVSDTGNKRLQVFDLTDFSLKQSVTTAKAYATIALDVAHSHLFAIELETSLTPPGHSIVVLDAQTLLPVARPLAVDVQGGDEHERAMYANDLAIDSKHNLLFVVDYGNARLDEFDLVTLASRGLIGVASRSYDYGYRNNYPNEVVAVTFDAAMDHLIVADDPTMHRLQIFLRDSLESLRDSHIYAPGKMATYEGQLFVVDKDPKTGARHVNVFGQSTAQLPDPAPP